MPDAPGVANVDESGTSSNQTLASTEEGMTSTLSEEPTAAVEQEADVLRSRRLGARTRPSLIATDVDGHVMLWNEGARQLYGYEASEVVGRLTWDQLHSAEERRAGRPRRSVDTALADGSWVGTLHHQRKDGAEFVAHVIMSPRYDRTDTLVGFLLISSSMSGGVPPVTRPPGAGR
jgi:PAS domain S-box-containing protein